MTTKNSLLQCVGLPLFIILYRKVCISQPQNGKPIGLIINKLKHKQNSSTRRNIDSKRISESQVFNREASKNKLVSLFYLLK